MRPAGRSNVPAQVDEEVFDARAPAEVEGAIYGVALGNPSQVNRHAFHGKKRRPLREDQAAVIDQPQLLLE